jgi:hypothetical protein
MSFSSRYGYAKSEIQFDKVDDILKNRIWGTFYQQEYDFYDTIEWANYTTGIEKMMIEMGISYSFPANRICKDKNANSLKDFLIKSTEWYLIYDFIEKYLNISEDKTAMQMIAKFNRILEEEASGYRIVNKIVVPITNLTEINTITEAIQNQFDSVQTHLSKALELYADRKKPDYENSVKESISAVEAMCCIITKMDGRDATLGHAMKKLKDNGIVVHPFMEEAFCKLYNYTSNAEGIRHGGINYTKVPSEDAKYMLVTCSAFINYLIEKWSKVQQK